MRDVRGVREGDLGSRRRGRRRGRGDGRRRGHGGRDVRATITITTAAAAAALLARAGDGLDEIDGREGLGGGSRLAVQRAVEDQDLVPRGAGDDGLADAAEDQGRDDGRVERADAVDDGLGVAEGFEDARVRWGPDLLAVGVDVPDAGDAGGEVLGAGLAEGDVLVAERGEGAREVVLLVGVRGGGAVFFAFAIGEQ